MHLKTRLPNSWAKRSLNVVTALQRRLKTGANFLRLSSGLGVLEELCGLQKTDLSSLLGIGGEADGPKIERISVRADNPHWTQR